MLDGASITPTQRKAYERSRAFHNRIATLAQELKVAIEAPVPKIVAAVAKTESANTSSIISARREYGEKNQRFRPLVSRIKKAVADEFGISVDDLCSQRRLREISVSRFVAIGLVMEMTDMSLPWIGRQFGGRGHTTILNAKRRAQELFSSEAFRNRVDQIKASL